MCLCGGAGADPKVIEYNCEAGLVPRTQPQTSLSDDQFDNNLLC